MMGNIAASLLDIVSVASPDSYKHIERAARTIQTTI